MKKLYQQVNLKVIIFQLMLLLPKFNSHLESNINLHNIIGRHKTVWYKYEL